MRSTPPPPFSSSAPPPDDDASAIAADGAPGAALPRTDPPRDAVLGDALRRLDAVPRADAERVQRAIVAAAQTRLAALSAPAWWEWTASWARPAIPLALAAGIAALAFALRAGSAPSQVSVESTVASATTQVSGESTASATTYSPAFLSVVGQAGAGSQVADAVVGPASHDWLVAQVVQP